MVHSISRRVGNFTRPCRDGNPVGNGGGGRGASGVDVRDLGRVARVVSQAKGVGSRPFRALVFCFGGTWALPQSIAFCPFGTGRWWRSGRGRVGRVGFQAEARRAFGRGLGRRGAGRRTPCARESCDSPSSPEPAASLFGGGWLLVGWREYGASRARACSERRWW
jgi:hypothetical protein